MNRLKHAALPLAPVLLLALGACESQADRDTERAEEMMEQDAEASAAAAGSAIAALGLTEAQLLDADLVGLDGADLGDVEQLHRDDAGEVIALVVEVEGSDPDRWVLVPLHGLTVLVNGDDHNLQTGMSAEDVAGLPEAEMTMPSATPAAAPAP